MRGGGGGGFDWAGSFRISGTDSKSRRRDILLRRAVSSSSDFAPGGSREASAALATPPCSAARPAAPAAIPSPILVRATRRPGAVSIIFPLERDRFKLPTARHCEERSDEAIQSERRLWI